MGVIATGVQRERGEGGREGEREGGREGGRKGGREGGREEGSPQYSVCMSSLLLLPSSPQTCDNILDL